MKGQSVGDRILSAVKIYGKARTPLSFNKKNVASNAGITVNRLNAIIKGTTIPSEYELDALCKTLSIEMGWLLTGRHLGVRRPSDELDSDTTN